MTDHEVMLRVYDIIKAHCRPDVKHALEIMNRLHVTMIESAEAQSITTIEAEFLTMLALHDAFASIRTGVKETLQ